MTIEPKLRAFILEMGANPDTLTEQQLLHAQATFEGREYHPEIVAGLEGEGERIESIEAIEPRAEMFACNPNHESVVAELKLRSRTARQN